MFDIAATCIVLTALLAYANQRLARRPTAIGVMVIALALSLGMLTSGATPTVGFAVKKLLREAGGATGTHWKAVSMNPLGCHRTPRAT